MSNGILALSVYKPSDGTTYQLDGANIAPDSLGYVAETNLSDTSKGSERKRNQTHTLEIRHNDSTFHSNLTGDTDYPNKSWRLAIAELNGFVLWEVTTTVNATMEEAISDPEAEQWLYTIRMKAVVSSGIARGVNLVYAHQKANGNATFADSDSNNIADGFTNQGMTINSFTAGEQDISWLGGTDRFFIDIFFPISGLLLTSGFTFSTVDSDAKSHIEIYNFAFSTLAQDQTALSGTGVVSASLTTLANTYRVRVEVQANNTATVVFNNPFCLLNGSEVFVNG